MARQKSKSAFTTERTSFQVSAFASLVELAQYSYRIVKRIYLWMIKSQFPHGKPKYGVDLIAIRWELPDDLVLLKEISRQQFPRVDAQK